MTKPQKYILDFSDRLAKREFLQRLAGLNGLWEITLKQRKRLVTTSQRGYYFAAVCPACARGMTEATKHYSEEFHEYSKDDAHELLKHRCLPLVVGKQSRRIVSPKTGEEIGQQYFSTADLDVREFGEYIERCKDFIYEFFGIEVLDPHLY